MAIYKTMKRPGVGLAFTSVICMMAAGHGLVHATPDASDYIRAVLLLTVPFLLKYFGGKARPLGMSWQAFAARRASARAQVSGPPKSAIITAAPFGGRRYWCPRIDQIFTGPRA